MKLTDLISDLNAQLRPEEIEDYPTAVNGLQIENNGEVTRVAVAVDACELVLRDAVAVGADLLLVHHGLFWSGLEPVTGARQRKIKLALDHNLAIYSMHLPLDVHAEFGNNTLLSDAVGMPSDRRSFLEIGCQADWEISRDELLVKISKAVGGRVHLAPGGPAICRRIGVITGGAGSEIFRAAEEGVDTFITGEGPHWSYPAAEESGVNLIYAGHYATETFGVKALGDYVERTHGLPWQFLDHPTGL